MALDAIIFDLDGTLVDTNRLHVRAWERAFAEHGFRVMPDRIAIEVGKGGDQLVPAILGKRADEEYGEPLRKAHPREYKKIVASEKVKVFDRSADLLSAVQERGLKAILATSSDEGLLAATERSSGLNVRDLVDAVVTGDAAKRTKPAPDLVNAAVKVFELSPAQCAMVGDSPYDAEAAKGAGVVTLALACGGFDEGTLRGAGARRVWRDPADLLEHLDEAIKIASPGPAHLTGSAMEQLMREAIEAAREGMKSGEVPIGCILANGDARVVGRGWNRLNATQNKTDHAEMVTFASAAGKVDAKANDLILVSTLEPCVMCTGAAMEAAVDTIVFGLRAPADNGSTRVRPPVSPESQMPRIIGDILAGESRALLQQWLNANERSEQAKFVRQLLSLT